MKPEEALKILEQATAPFKGSREDHITISTALSVLSGLIPKETQEEVEVEHSESNPDDTAGANTPKGKKVSA